MFVLISKKKLAQRDRERDQMWAQRKQIGIKNTLNYNLNASVEDLNTYLRLDKTAVIKKVFLNKQGVLSFVIMVPSGENILDLYVRSSEIRTAGTCKSENPFLDAKIFEKEGEIKILNVISGQYKSRGYGRALMETLFAIAEEKHINKIFGELSWMDEQDSYNEHVRNKFYEAMGFEFQGNKVVKELKTK